MVCRKRILSGGLINDSKSDEDYWEANLDNLIVKSKNLIDADSPVIQLKNVRSQMLGNGQESFASKGALIFIDALKEKYMTLRKKEY